MKLLIELTEDKVIVSKGGKHLLTLPKEAVAAQYIELN
jgi:hypothetical protein